MRKENLHYRIVFPAFQEYHWDACAAAITAQKRICLCILKYNITEEVIPVEKRKTYSEKCPVCGRDIHPIGDQTVCYDELPPGTAVLAEVTPGKWVKVVERKPAKT